MEDEKKDRFFRGRPLAVPIYPPVRCDTHFLVRDPLAWPPQLMDGEEAIRRLGIDMEKWEEMVEEMEKELKRQLGWKK